MSFSEVFRDRHYEPGYVYIAGSLSARVLKIGTCLHAHKQGQYLRYKRYGGITDWKVLYYVRVDQRGMIEHDARRYLRRMVRHYEKDGRWQRGREMVRCDFSVALSALSRCLTEEQRATAWQSSKCDEFDFDAREMEALLLAAEIREAAQKISFKPVFLKKVSELELSVRSANCLANEEIVYIGDLVQKSEGELLRAPFFGRKSLNEIKGVLAQLDLHLGVSGINGWPHSNAKALESFIDTPFLKTVEELQMSVRSLNCLKSDDVFLIGDLVQKTEADMLRTPNFGRKSLNEIKVLLVAMGLHLGMKLLGWPARWRHRW